MLINFDHVNKIIWLLVHETTTQRKNPCLMSKFRSSILEKAFERPLICLNPPCFTRLTSLVRFNFEKASGCINSMVSNILISENFILTRYLYIF